MRFSAPTDSFLEAPCTDPHRIFGPPRTPYVKQPLRRQPHYLLADVLLEIMGWLAYMDWLVCSDPLRFSTRQLDHPVELSARPGYSLIRATHICRYWRIVALENRSLWSYVSLSETLSRHFQKIDREFTTRVQRSLGLSRELQVSYAEFPIHEQLQHRYPYPVSLPTIPIKSAPPYGPTSELTSNFSCFLPNGYSISPEDLSPIYCYSLWSLYPLLVDCIKRCTVLTLKGTGYTLTSIFGHTLDHEFWGHPFESTVMLGTFVHPSFGPSLNPNSISALPLLTELTIELMDATDRYAFPSFPSLRKLTLVRQVAQPHLRLPVLYTFFDHHTLWDSATRLPSPTCPKLMEFRLFAPNVLLITLHHFLIAHSRTLTSVTLHTTTDIFHPSGVPLLLHPANFAVPRDATNGLFPVPHYADIRLDTSAAAFVVNLPKLRSLSVQNLTGLLSPHIEVLACPSLHELELVSPSRLPPPSTFLTTSYINLRKLTYRFPESTLTRETWNGGIHSNPDPRGVSEQDSSSRLLVSLLKNLFTLEELIVEGWVFWHIWGEEDWIASLMPPSAIPIQQRTLEDDLEAIKDDPWDPDRRPEDTGTADSKPERWQTQDGIPFDMKYARMSETGLMMDDKGEVLVLLDFNEENDGDYSDDAESAPHTNSSGPSYPTLESNTDASQVAQPISLLLPRLSKLELRRCYGVERSSMFPCMRERLRLWQKSQSGVSDAVGGTGEASWTIAASSSPSDVAAPNHAVTLVSERLSTVTGALHRGEDGAVPEHNPLTEFCAQTIVAILECALTEEEFRDLYSQFLCGEYVVRKPRKPRPPTPIPLDERKLS